MAPVQQERDQEQEIAAKHDLAAVSADLEASDRRQDWSDHQQRLIDIIRAGRDIGRFVLSSTPATDHPQLAKADGPVILVGWGSTVSAAYHIADGLVAERGTESVAGVVALTDPFAANCATEQGTCQFNGGLRIAQLADSLPAVRQRLRALRVKIVEVRCL
eukprot:SAG31_NODE_683_length_12836_cov_8.304938_9_plen_161_part_00